MSTTVIVAGAGPVGLFLAAELALCGAHPVVVEQLDAPTEHSKARGIGPLATEALTRRGLGPRLAEANLRGRADIVRDHGSALGHFAGIHKLVPDQDRPSTLIWQPELERVLAEHAEALGVPVLRGHRVVAVESVESVESAESDVDGAGGAGGVTVVVRTGHGERRLDAAYLVGCDGGRSAVRDLAGFDFPGTPALLRTVAGRPRFTGAVPAAGRYPTGAFLHGGGMAGVTEPATGTDPAGPVTPAELAAAIRRVTGADVALTDLHDTRRFSDHARQVDTYRRGRVLLAGDAAHVHSPSGGQGLNLGLLDAANLGWKLAAVLRGDLPEAVLDSYSRERHPAGAAVLRNTRAQSALLAPGPHVDALREVVADLMDLPAANRYFTDLLSSTNLRYDFPYPTTDPVGRHSPDLVLTGPDGTVSRLHEHTGSGRGLLLTAGDDDLAATAAGRVAVVPVTDPGPRLLRPDGVIAWLPGGPASLATALDTWFGPVSATAPAAPRSARARTTAR